MRGVAIRRPSDCNNLLTYRCPSRSPHNGVVTFARYTEQLDVSTLSVGTEVKTVMDPR